MQKIFTKNRGSFDFHQTWIKEGGRHLGLLCSGGYLMTSGLPIPNESFLKDVIPEGKDLTAALKWWKNKDDPNTKKKSIKVSPDNTYSFNDGSPIETVTDLIENMPSGPTLDAALRWWAKKQEQEEFEAMKAKAKSAKENRKPVKI